MNKLFNKALLVLFVLTLLFSCSKKEAKGTSQTVSTQSGSTQTKAEAPAKPIEINLSYGAAITEAGSIPSDWPGFKILKDKYNIDLKLSALPSNETDQDVRIQAMGAANNLPDVFMVSRSVLNNLVKQGLVAPVDDMYKMMPTRTAQQYDKDSIAHTTINGKSYGLASPGSIAKNEGLLIRKDWLDNLGLAVPTTLDELYDVMYAFRYNDPDQNGVKDTWGYGAYVESDSTLKGYPGARLFPIMGAFGVEGVWDFTEGEEGLMIKKPEFYDFMVFMKKMIDNDVIDPNWLSYKKDDFRAAWKQGRFGVMKEQNAAYAATANYAPFDKNFPDGEWIIVDAITGPKGDASIGAYDQNYRIYAISAKAVKDGKKEAIANLLEWMSSPEGYYLCGWGQEGVNYTLDQDGVPKATEGDMGFTGSKGQVYTQLRNMVFYNSDTELISRYPTYITETSHKEMSALKALREMQEKTWTANIGAGTMPQPNADVKRFYEQNLGEFLTGAKKLTPENWAKFLSDFDKMGGKAWEDAGIEKMKADGLVVKK